MLLDRGEVGFLRHLEEGVEARLVRRSVRFSAPVENPQHFDQTEGDRKVVVVLDLGKHFRARRIDPRRIHELPATGVTLTGSQEADERIVRGVQDWPDHLVPVLDQQLLERQRDGRLEGVVDRPRDRRVLDERVERAYDSGAAVDAEDFTRNFVDRCGEGVPSRLLPEGDLGSDRAQKGLQTLSREGQLGERFVPAAHVLVTRVGFLDPRAQSLDLPLGFGEVLLQARGRLGFGLLLLRSFFRFVARDETESENSKQQESDAHGTTLPSYLGECPGFFLECIIHYYTYLSIILLAIFIII